MTERPRIATLLRPSHALGRLVSALALGIIAGFLLRLRYSAVLAAVGGWNVAALLLLGYAWRTYTMPTPRSRIRGPRRKIRVAPPSTC